MIKSAITHPPLLAALAQCGHKTQVLIADGNYACVTHAPKDATVVYLNWRPARSPPRRSRKNCWPASTWKARR